METYFTEHFRERFADGLEVMRWRGGEWRRGKGRLMPSRVYSQRPILNKFSAKSLPVFDVPLAVMSLIKRLI